ncbi:hypothetical protein EV384_1807 [Micromonospora kangleipakensis]|uniref:Uncharacterized protein n=1 Tax=Micromonospora kangleipakensis TaxID=1077942 RepID=A0A4Q8B6X8_9ACTN|nr:hypothetical protein [Micromonospora kangleipakensis]RZU73404.1 hypothetical protein EV384_1807 [Micromonospora kangleipakensis]
MGILADYFAATPGQALTTVDAGPGDELRPLRPKFLEPFVLVGALWEVMRHGHLGSPRTGLHAGGERVDGNDDEGPYLIRLVSEFVTELAALPDDRIDAVAAGWATAEEWMGEPELEIVAQLVGELRRVAPSGDRRRGGVLLDLRLTGGWVRAHPPAGRRPRRR